MVLAHGIRKMCLRRGIFTVIGMIVMIAMMDVAVGATSVMSDVSNGKVLYQNNCAGCHGRSGKGDGYKKFNPPVADLTSSVIQHRLTDDLVAGIHRGRPNTAMGSWRLALSEQELHDVVAYLRTLKQD